MAPILRALRSTPDRLTAAVPGWGWLMLAGCYLASCWASIVTRTQWGPDSRLYLAWAYRYLGHSEIDAARRTKSFLVAMDGVRGGCDTLCWNPGFEHAFFHGADGAVVGARPLYPLLSAPFVGLFGPNGMLVVPLLSYAFVIIGVALLAHRLWGRHWGLLAGLLILAPVIVSRWAVMAQTEGLAIGLTVACLLFLPLGRVTGSRDLLWFGVLMLLNLCVRQFALALTAGVVLVWLMVAVRDRRVRNAWVSFALVAVGVTGFALVVQSFVTSRWFGGGALDLTARYTRLTQQTFHTSGLPSIPKVLRYILRNDYAYVRGDVLLLATVVLAVIAICWRWRSELAVLTAGAALTTIALNMLVIWPTYYRYMAPIHPLVLLAALALIADWTARPHRPPSRSTEAVPAPVGIGEPRRQISVPGWALVGLTVLGIAGMVWRRDRPPVAASLLALSFLLLAAAVVLVALAVSRRVGASAGVLAGLTLALSGAVVGRVLASWRDAIVLLAAAVVVALLDRADPAARRNWRALAGVAVATGVAGAAHPAGVALAGGAALAWLADTVVRRRAANAWAPYAQVAVAVSALVLGCRLALGGMAWYPQSLNHVVSADFRAIAPDRALYLTCLVAAVAVVVRWRAPMSWFAIGTVAVATVVHVGHSGPAGFADFLAGYPALLVVAAAALTPALVPRAATDPAAVERGAAELQIR
jgi:hypothetical protein